MRIISRNFTPLSGIEVKADCRACRQVVKPHIQLIDQIGQSGIMPYQQTAFTIIRQASDYFHDSSFRSKIEIFIGFYFRNRILHFFGGKGGSLERSPGRRSQHQPGFAVFFKNKFTVSIPNPPLYRLKKNGLGVTSLSKSVLSLFYLVLREQFFPVYWSLQGRYFFECGS